MKPGAPSKRSTSNSRKNEGPGTVERGISGRQCHHLLARGRARIQHATRNVLIGLRSGGAEPAIVVSALSLLECRVHPIRTGDEARLEKFDHFFANPGLSNVELDANVIERATQLRARHGIRTPDALQAASALTLLENPAIITGDKDFRKIPELNVQLVE